MAVSEVTIKYAAKGAKAAQRADKNVRDSIKETARTARKESGTIRQWMQRHKTALMGIGAATAAAMGAIIKASPELSAQLASVRLGFSLLAMTIGSDIAPATEGLSEKVLDLADAYADLDPAIRKPISGFIAFLGIVGIAAGVIAGLETLVSGTIIATLGSKLAGAVAGSAGAMYGLAAAAGLLLGLFGVWVLQVTGVLDKVRGLGNYVGSVLSPRLLDLGLSFWAVATLGIVPLMSILGAFITGFLEGGLPKGIARAKEALSVWTGAFGRTKDRIIEYVAKLAAKILVKLSNFKEKWSKRLSLIKKLGVLAWENLKDRVTEIVGGMADDAYQWGKDLVSNFISGLRAKARAAGNAADNVASRVKSSLSFDITSNDRMAERWGKDLVEHFNKGMESNSSMLSANAPGGSPGSFGLPTPGSGGGGGGTSIEITIEEGAVQMRGSGNGRVDTDRLAREVSKNIDSQFGRQ